MVYAFRRHEPLSPESVWAHGLDQQSEARTLFAYAGQVKAAWVTNNECVNNNVASFGS